MKKILAINGSMRKNGNTAQLLSAFLKDIHENAVAETFYAHEINLEYCTGCLRCNLIRRCSIRGDEWETLAAKILDSDILVFATPVYFHHVTGQLKKVIDRFRSFVHVAITETGLKHTPHALWNKDFVLLLTLGSSSDDDAKPVMELFKYMVGILGSENRLHVVVATRLGVVSQIVKSEEDLSVLYSKIGLPTQDAAGDFIKNSRILQQCASLGKMLTH